MFARLDCDKLESPVRTPFAGSAHTSPRSRCSINVYSALNHLRSAKGGLCKVDTKKAESFVQRLQKSRQDLNLCTLKRVSGPRGMWNLRNLTSYPKAT